MFLTAWLVVTIVLDFGRHLLPLFPLNRRPPVGAAQPVLSA
ncbi:hypothetical protein ACWGJB_16550 [Streptomyces sp. NPDC054813]